MATIETHPRLRTQLFTPERLDAAALAAELSHEIRGEVRFEEGDRALWAADSSNYRQIPLGVVLPADVEDAIRAIAIAREHRAPLVARGGGTSLAGQACNLAVVLDFSKYVNGVLEVDPERRRVRVQAGTNLDDLRRAAAVFGLTFGPDPATHNRNTLGGMIGNNSCGVHSMLSEFYGPGPRTSEQVEELDVLTYDGARFRVGRHAPDDVARIVAEGGRQGEIYRRLQELVDRHGDLIRERFPDILRCVSGYNLPALLPENGFDVAKALVGSEGTCVTVLEATLTLIPNPTHRVMLVLGYADIFAAADDVPRVRTVRPIALEGMDEALTEAMRKKGLHTRDLGLLPDGRGWLLVEFGGASPAEAEARAREAMSELGGGSPAPAMMLHTDPAAQRRLWRVRESGLGATSFIPGQPPTWPGWEDSAVPVDRIGPYLKDLMALMKRHDYAACLYGHFGQGLIHCRIDFDLVTSPGIRSYLAFMHEAAHLVTDYGGSLSGEHGDGQARGELLPIMFGEEMMPVFREFKAIWDPTDMMNPGKLIDAYPMDANLRLGSDYRPAMPETHFRFPHDGGSIAHAALRCVGVGLCRRSGEDGGLMCPSYMVLREEKHATRGRAHLLFEMLQGETIADGWKSEEVKESLDLCLACKGCKGECPVQVDVATLKAEFLSHYYERKLRPRQAYAFGLIQDWARIAALAPGLANLFTQTPGLRGIAKAVAGIAPQRDVPAFAPRTFKSWFRRRGARNPTGPRVVLWADTFNNHFFPDTLAAAVEVIEATGFHVIVPEPHLCCGRPLYDYGFLDQARRYLRRVLDALRPEMEAGTPLVGLEPSCVSVFRDELIELFPEDDDAARLSHQASTLGEFLHTYAPDFTFPRLDRPAIAHAHCHHRAVLNYWAEEEVLGKVLPDVKAPDSGCCGLAGSFGFTEGEHYDVSMAAGERVLLPAVREAGEDTLIVADGFSCREQIDHGTGRRALHTAEVLRMALEQGRAGVGDAEIERSRAEREELIGATRPAVSAAGLGLGLLAGGAVAWALVSRR